MPFYRYSFEVPLPPEVVAERIRAVTAEKRWTFKSLFPFLEEEESNLFWGRVDRNSFRLQRKTYWRRDSFQPDIVGRIKPFGSGSRVSITMFLHPFVAIFMVSWLTFIGYGAVTTLMADSPQAVILFAMFLLGLILGPGGFVSGVVKAKKEFRFLLPPIPGAQGS